MSTAAKPRKPDEIAAAVISVAKIRLTFLEDLLGTASGNEEIFKEFIASKRPDEPDPRESAALPIEEAVEKSMTVFTRDDAGRPCLWDYQIKGFFKDACGCLSRLPGSESNRLKAFKKVIDGLFFVGPRMISLILPDGAKIGTCTRPLRAETAQGPRIALAHSESVPAGSTMEFEVTMLDGKYDGLLQEWLQYGKLRGLGQWRNSGKGRFSFERIK